MVRRQAKAAYGSHLWSVVVVEEVGGVGGGFRGRDGGKNGCFMLLDVFVACKTRPSEIWLAWTNSAPTNFTALGKISYLIL